MVANGHRVRAAAWRATLAAVAAMALCAPVLASDGSATLTGDRLDAVARRLANANSKQCRPSDTDRCNGRFIVVPGSTVNAWADGRNVMVTARMMRTATEDSALAFVVAHELAHNILAHAKMLKDARSSFANECAEDVSARIRRTEVEADQLAIELVANAGFDTQASERIIISTMKGRSTGQHGTHPDAASRISAIRTAFQALRPRK